MSYEEAQLLRQELAALKLENAALKQEVDTHKEYASDRLLEYLRGDRLLEVIQDSKDVSFIEVVKEIINAYLELEDSYDADILELHQHDIRVLLELDDELKSAERLRDVSLFAAFGGQALTLSANLGLFVSLGCPTLGAVLKGVGIAATVIGGTTALYENCKAEKLWADACTLINRASRRFQPLGEAALKFQKAAEKISSKLLPEKLEEICKSSKKFTDAILAGREKFQKTMCFAFGAGIVLQALEIIPYACQGNYFAGTFCEIFSQILHTFILYNSKSTSRQKNMEDGIKLLLDQFDVICTVVRSNGEK